MPHPRKPGRPSLPPAIKRVNMPLRVSPVTVARVRAMALVAGESRGRCVDRAVAALFRRHREETP